MTFCAALCWFQSDGNSGLATLIAQLLSRKAPAYIRVQCLCVCVCKCACLRVCVPPCCMTEPAHLSIFDRVCCSGARPGCSEWHPPGGLLSEEHRAEDLAQGSGAEQVLGAVLAHSSEMPEQTLESQPVLWGQAWGAGDATQQRGTFLRIRHLCWNRNEARGQRGGKLIRPRSKSSIKWKTFL